jgi:hypothetical protein
MLKLLVTRRVPDPDPHGAALIRVAGSGSGRAKMTHKKEKKEINFMPDPGGQK